MILEFLAHMCLLAYVGFLRCSGLAHARRSHIVFHETYFDLHIPASETDVLHNLKAKVWLYLISRTGKSTCPYAMLRLYLKAANIADSDECYICRSLAYCSRSKT